MLGKKRLIWAFGLGLVQIWANQIFGLLALWAEKQIMEGTQLFVAVLSNSKWNYLDITVRTLITATKAVILLSWPRSRNSNVTSPKSCPDKGHILVLVVSTRI